jgi:lipopolysaccharide biosynthesis regulator YciM
MSTSGISVEKRIAYAMGYLELGLINQASDELESIEGEARLTIQVMLARIELYMAAKDWELLVAVAKGVARADPKQEQAWISWAYGQRRHTSLADAKPVLLEAEQHIGETCAMLYYNLACYECQLGDIEAAKVRLRRARKIGGNEFRALALDDEDLKPMWAQIAAMK